MLVSLTHLFLNKTNEFIKLVSLIALNKFIHFNFYKFILKIGEFYVKYIFLDTFQILLYIKTHHINNKFILIV